MLSPEHGESNAMNKKQMHSGLHVHNPKSSDFDGNNATNSQDCFRWPSSESSLQNDGLNKDDYSNINGLKISDSAWRGDNSNSKSLCPASDEWNQQTNKPDKWSQQYGGRDRRRNRDRAWTRRDDRGRSQSRGRNRSCSRGGSSRSRSRKRGKPRVSRRWNRSPPHDQMHEIFDRKSISGISFRPCRHFAAGKCMRGSQCRFLHEDNFSSKDVDFTNYSSERWRCRPEYKVALKDGNDKGLNSDNRRENIFYGYGNGELLKNNRKANSCKNFLKGHCPWGSSCRFSHNDAFNDNYEGGDRKASFSHDNQHEASKSSKVPCKYFMMGKCHLDDCRFSHDEHTSGNFELWSCDSRSGHSLDGKSKSCNGSTCDNEADFLSITRSRDLDEGFSENVNFADTLAVEKRAGGGWEHASEEIRMLGSSAWLNRAPERNVNQDSGNNFTDMSTISSIEKLVDREDYRLGLRGSHGTLEASSHQLANAVLQPKISESHFYQMSPGKGMDLPVTDSWNALTDFKLSRDSIHPVLLPGRSFDKTNASMGSHPFILSSIISNGQTDLSRKVQHEVSPSVLEKQMEFHHEPAVKHQMMELEVPTITSEIIESVVSSETVVQIANLLEVVAQSLGNTQWLPQSDAVLDPLNSMGAVASQSNYVSLVPHINAVTVEPRPATRFRKLDDPIGGVMEPGKAGNSDKPPGYPLPLSEQKNKIPMKQLSVSSSVNFTSSKFHQHDSSKQEYQASPRMEQERPVNNVEAYQNNQIVAKEGKGEQANDGSENVDAEGGVKEDGRSKDEKGMHLFRLALVELVKEILKPTWKEGKMSREVHKTIVKKVVDKVTSTIQGDHVPKTEEKVSQYLSFSETKITKFVQAYVEKFRKN